METEAIELKLGVEWTDDCQGKKNYDGDILSISSRYWPRGGGFGIMTSEGVKHNHFQDIKPSATSSLVLSTEAGDFEIALKGFEGETEEEVKTMVEAWAQEQMNKVVELLRAGFAISPPQ